MKMAKASEADLTMAMELANFLDSIERGYMPDPLSADDDCGERLDTNDREQYDRLIEGLQDLLSQGSIMRVIFGMAVCCDPSNELIDPEASTLEHHPKRNQMEASNELLKKQRDELLAICEELQESAEYWSEYFVPLGIVERLDKAIANVKASAS